MKSSMYIIVINVFANEYLNTNHVRDGGFANNDNKKTSICRGVDAHGVTPRIEFRSSGCRKTPNDSERCFLRGHQYRLRFIINVDDAHVNMLRAPCVLQSLVFLLMKICVCRTFICFLSQ